MLNHIKRSFDDILRERTTSPLFGTLIVSWCIFNWKIIYITLFVSESKMSITKIAYIVNYCSNPYNLYLYPLVSTVFLLTIIPFLNNGSYFLKLKFDNWRIKIKHRLEENMLLTIEQSTALREQMRQFKMDFKQTIDTKDEEIKTLKNQLQTQPASLQQNEIREFANTIKYTSSGTIIIGIFEQIYRNSSLELETNNVGKRLILEMLIGLDFLATKANMTSPGLRGTIAVTITNKGEILWRLIRR